MQMCYHFQDHLQRDANPSNICDDHPHVMIFFVFSLSHTHTHTFFILREATGQAVFFCLHIPFQFYHLQNTTKALKPNTAVVNTLHVSYVKSLCLRVCVW